MPTCRVKARHWPACCACRAAIRGGCRMRCAGAMPVPCRTCSWAARAAGGGARSCTPCPTAVAPSIGNRWTSRDAMRPRRAAWPNCWTWHRTSAAWVCGSATCARCKGAGTATSSASGACPTPMPRPTSPPRRSRSSAKTVRRSIRPSASRSGAPAPIATASACARATACCASCARNGSSRTVPTGNPSASSASWWTTPRPGTWQARTAKRRSNWGWRSNWATSSSGATTCAVIACTSVIAPSSCWACRRRPPT